MKRASKLLTVLVSLGMVTSLFLTDANIAQATSRDNCLSELSSGITSILETGSYDASTLINATARKLNLDMKSITTEEEEESLLVMTNVKGTLNVRTGPDEYYPKVGMLYKDCGGTILERKDGWTKIQSGNVVGWCSDQYLFFGEEAIQCANEAGKLLAVIDTESLRVRKTPSYDGEVLGILPQGEMVEVMNDEDEEWIQIDYEGTDGYVAREFVTLNFKIDTAQTMEEIKAKQESEAEKNRYKKYGAVDSDEETLILFAALIHCEAGGESYEGQVAVGAVVMNRVRSKAYPNTIKGVIYASGQFTPAMTGKLDRLIESGKIYESCFKAAKEALAGTSNVGDLTHFRRNNGRDGLVIGNHVFY